MKRCAYIALVILLCCSFMFRVNAAEIELGSIEIKVEYRDTKVTGGNLVAVKVGYLDDDNRVFRKVTNHDEIKKIGQSTVVTKMQNFYTSNKNTYDFEVYKADVKDGIARFTDIPMGLYLVYQEKAASGFNKLSSFLVTVPYDGEKDVTVASKTELEREASPETEPTAPPSDSDEKLPQTGQLTWPVPWLALTGMIMFVFGWWLCFGKRKDSQ